MRDPKTTRTLSFVLIAVAVGLIVLHFALDAGDTREAPGWMVWAAVAAALAGMVLGSVRAR